MERTAFGGGGGGGKGGETGCGERGGLYWIRGVGWGFELGGEGRGRGGEERDCVLGNRYQIERRSILMPYR